MARVPNWTSIGVVFCFFLWFLRFLCVCFFATCRQIGFKCFRGRFVYIPGSADIGKYTQNAVGSFKNNGWEHDNILQHGVTREVPKWHLLSHFRASLATNSTKKTPKKHTWKQAFFGRLQNAVPEATPPSERSRDVRPRRSNRAFWKGKVKARSQKAQHLGQDSQPKGVKSEIQDPNYIYAHLLKGGLYV